MKPLRIAVLAHAGGLETVLRHDQIWAKQDPDYILLMPEGQEITPLRHRCWSVEPDDIQFAMKNGPGSQRRLVRLLQRWESEPSAVAYMVAEYDSFVYPALPWHVYGPAVWGTWSCAIDQRGCYLNAPWFFPGCLLRLISHAMASIKGMFQSGNNDRLFPLVARMIGVPICGFPSCGAAGGTFHPWEVELVRQGIRCGARSWHGVKSKEILDVILNAKDEIRQSNPLHLWKTILLNL